LTAFYVTLLSGKETDNGKNKIEFHINY